MSDHSHSKKVPIIRINGNTGSDASTEEIESVHDLMSKVAQASILANSAFGEATKHVWPLIQERLMLMSRLAEIPVERWHQLAIEEVMTEVQALEEVGYH